MHCWLVGSGVTYGSRVIGWINYALDRFSPPQETFVPDDDEDDKLI